MRVMPEYHTRHRARSTCRAVSHVHCPACDRAVSLKRYEYEMLGDGIVIKCPNCKLEYPYEEATQ